jgi:selenocysteine-specific translation elongation factor
VLTIEPLRSVTELECEVKASKFAEDSKHLHAFVGLQSVACEVKGLKTGGIARAIIRFKQPVAFDKEAIALCDLNKALPRVIGVAREA